MKKIAILISGQIRIFEKNINFINELKKILSEFDITIVSSVWENQDEFEHFKEKYNVKFINLVKEQDWTNYVSKIKYVTWEENSGFKIPNIFHMWHSILENIRFLEKINDKENKKFDFVMRFRTDIMCKKSLNFLPNEINSLKDNEILFPSNLHWKGLNDTFFISNFSTMLKFKDFFSFLEKFVEDNRVFNPEYVLYSFVDEKKLKIKLISESDLALIRVEDSKPTKIVFIPFKDKIKMKIVKQKIKLLKFQNKLKLIFK